ncbi:unnamed protein product [Rhodiola kirilowii]
MFTDPQIKSADPPPPLLPSSDPLAASDSLKSLRIHLRQLFSYFSQRSVLHARHLDLFPIP